MSRRQRLQESFDLLRVRVGLLGSECGDVFFSWSDVYCSDFPYACSGAVCVHRVWNKSFALTRRDRLDLEQDRFRPALCAGIQVDLLHESSTRKSAALEVYLCTEIFELTVISLQAIPVSSMAVSPSTTKRTSAASTPSPTKPPKLLPVTSIAAKTPKW